MESLKTVTCRSGCCMIASIINSKNKTDNHTCTVNIMHILLYQKYNR